MPYPHNLEGTFILSFCKQKRKDILKMKKTIKSTVSVLLAIVFAVCFVACNTAPKEGLWEEATYLHDTELGEGENTVVVEVSAGEESITFTVKTDKETVGDALIEHELIEGEQGDYGLYIKKVNGIVADADIDGSYWAFYIDGEYAMTGVSETEINSESTYKLEYTK